VRCVSEHLSFDSAVLWGQSLRWDGVQRVERFFERYMTVPDSAYARSVGLYLWTALAGRCMEPGCKVDMVPVLIGAQGSGKTSMVEALAPTDEAFIEINLAQRNEDQMARSLNCAAWPGATPRTSRPGSPDATRRSGRCTPSTTPSMRGAW
jgi:Virulence-associated protein E